MVQASTSTVPVQNCRTECYWGGLILGRRASSATADCSRGWREDKAPLLELVLTQLPAQLQNNESPQNTAKGSATPSPSQGLHHQNMQCSMAAGH